MKSKVDKQTLKEIKIIKSLTEEVFGVKDLNERTNKRPLPDAVKVFTKIVMDSYGGWSSYRGNDAFRGHPIIGGISLHDLGVLHLGGRTHSTLSVAIREMNKCLEVGIPKDVVAKYHKVNAYMVEKELMYIDEKIGDLQARRQEIITHKCGMLAQSNR